MRSPAELTADCGRCFALCCVAPAFARSADFAIDKPAGVACPHLADDHRCSIHAGLREEGFAGCTAYDCFGAGQRVAQETYAGRDWREHPELAASMMAALPVVRGLHELLWHLDEARSRATSEPLRSSLDALAARVEGVASRPAPGSAHGELDGLRAEVAPLLRQVSEQARAGLGGPGLAEEDLSGRDLRRSDLRGACLRGARLIGADLRELDLSLTDLLGADLRAADLRGARLDAALYLTRTQIGGASGDRRTTLPARLDRPAHWSH